MSEQQNKIKHTELSEAILAEIRNELQKASRPAEEIILDDVDLRFRLNVSKRTTATWREELFLKHSKIRGKIFYRLSDVLQFIQLHQNPQVSQSIKIKL